MKPSEPGEPTPAADDTSAAAAATTMENQPSPSMPVPASLRAAELALVGWMYVGGPVVAVLLSLNPARRESTTAELAVSFLSLVAVPVVGIAVLTGRLRHLGRAHGQPEFASWAALVPLLSLAPVVCLSVVEFLVLDRVTEDWPGSGLTSDATILVRVGACGLLNGGLVLGLTRLGWSRGWAAPRVLRWGWRGAAAVVAVIALALAAIVPVLLRTGAESRDKAILSNARVLAAAADQYYLENGVTTVAFSRLVDPAGYVKALHVEAGEKYPAYFTQGETITVNGVAGVRTITYAP